MLGANIAVDENLLQITRKEIIRMEKKEENTAIAGKETVGKLKSRSALRLV